MSRSVRRDVLLIVIALSSALTVTVGVIALFRKSGIDERLKIEAPVRTRSATVAVTTTATRTEHGASNDDVPEEILETAADVMSPEAPGIQLIRTRPGARSNWEKGRAEITDLSTGVRRTFSIGDLLPHGSLLVGISTTAIDIMVADAHLVRLHQGGEIEAMQDLTAEVEAVAFRPIKDEEPVDADEIRLALFDLKSDDPSTVQIAIDRLIAGGDPAIELLLATVDSELTVAESTYAFPSDSRNWARPRTLSEVTMLILEQITGQTFGDLSKQALSDQERRTIAGAWRRALE